MKIYVNHIYIIYIYMAGFHIQNVSHAYKNICVTWTTLYMWKTLFSSFYKLRDYHKPVKNQMIEFPDCFRESCLPKNYTRSERATQHIYKPLRLMAENGLFGLGCWCLLYKELAATMEIVCAHVSLFLSHCAHVCSAPQVSSTTRKGRSSTGFNEKPFIDHPIKAYSLAHCSRTVVSLAPTHTSARSERAPGLFVCTMEIWTWGDERTPGGGRVLDGMVSLFFWSVSPCVFWSFVN